jgi:hypothetical protein
MFLIPGADGSGFLNMAPNNMKEATFVESPETVASLST